MSFRKLFVSFVGINETVEPKDKSKFKDFLPYFKFISVQVSGEENLSRVVTM